MNDSITITVHNQPTFGIINAWLNNLANDFISIDNYQSYLKELGIDYDGYTLPTEVLSMIIMNFKP